MVIALLVCLGLMAHAASIDAGTTAAASAVVTTVDSVDSGTVVLSTSPPVESQMFAAIGALELCAFLGVMCALMLLILRSLSSLPFRSDRTAPRQSSDSQGTFRALFSVPAPLPTLMVPLRV